MVVFLSIFLSVCLPILLLAGLGWGLDRIFQFDLKTLVKLNIYLFVPAFILTRLSSSELESETGLAVVGFTLAMILAMGLLSRAVSAATRLPAAQGYSMKLSTMIYNCGNWGIPLMTLAFGETGGIIQVFVLATMNVASFSLGILLANAGSHDRKGWFLPILKQPSPWAVLIALTLRHFGNPLEEVPFLWVPLSYLADALIAFALITLGVQLAKTKPPGIRGPLGHALVIRLLGGPAVAMLLTWSFGFEGTIAAILILGAAAPTAVNTALLAHEFNGDSRFAAAAVFYSTLAASVVVTAILAILRAGWIPWAIP